MPIQTPVKNKMLQGDQSTAANKAVVAAPPSIFDKIPVSLVLMLAKPYLAGETAKEALELAEQLYKENKFSSTLDILGEDAISDADCDQSVEHYKQLIDQIAAHKLPGEQRQQPTASFKPSMFSTAAPKVGQTRSIELDRAYNRIEAVVEYASVRNVNVTLEAEDHRWTDFQLETYFSLIESGYRNLGTVLQTRLFRTAQDIKRFDSRMRTRLVVGIYNEPATVAHTQKPIMKDLLVKYARELLARGTYVEVATHDTKCIENFFNTVVIPDKVPTNRFETQYLHGVPRKRFQKTLVSGEIFQNLEAKGKSDAVFQKLAAEGILVRMYLPFGEGKVAGAYCRRRLKENPNMAVYGIKNLLKLDS
ncbi:MAG: proline dehydrogenase family protein [Candidatus Melainabacteria bacterium]|nr:proline dehydrogenase family protein [Candidatus Melainabacteria bacterium]